MNLYYIGGVYYILYGGCCNSIGDIYVLMFDTNACAGTLPQLSGSAFGSSRYAVLYTAFGLNRSMVLCYKLQV